MPNVQILENGCRGCTLCSDTCPVDVFTMNEGKNIATVDHAEDCIGCLSCFYQCPSQCIEISDIKYVKPFHRIEKNIAFVEQFLQTPTASTSLTKEELNIACKEIGILLINFSTAISEILGRGHKSVGRRSGTVAAKHIPELYEQKDLESLLTSMKSRFGSSFDFEHAIFNNEITFSVKPCGLLQYVEQAGMELGTSNLCLLFHEYWAGLISSYTGIPYIYEILDTSNGCQIKFTPKDNA